MESHGLGVAAAQALSNVGVVKALTVAKARVADAQAKGKTETEAASHAQIVGVEVGTLSASLVVHDGASRTEGTHDAGGGAAEDLIHVVDVEELHVEVLGVELDKVDALDLSAHVLVALLLVVFVVGDVWAVSSSHFDQVNSFLYNYNFTLNHFPIFSNHGVLGFWGFGVLICFRYVFGMFSVCFWYVFGMFLVCF